MRYSLWNLCARSDAAALLDALTRAGFACRTLDTAGIATDDAFLARGGETFGLRSGGWDAFADDMWRILFPDDGEGAKVALVWHHADALLDGGLATLLRAMDVLIDIGRTAYAEQIEVITFLLGDGPNFAPVDIAALFPDLD